MRRRNFRMQDGHSCPSHDHETRSKQKLLYPGSRSILRTCLVQISDMNVQATGTEPQLRIWPSCVKLSRQDATTAYACLRDIIADSAGTRCIMSLEDPVEVAVDGATQSQVRCGEFGGSHYPAAGNADRTVPHPQRTANRDLSAIAAENLHELP